MNNLATPAPTLERYDNKAMGLNITDEEILANIKVNIRRHLPQLKTYNENTEQKIAIVGGGPSLEDTFHELLDFYTSGGKLVALNNTHDWLLNYGMKPSMHVLVDAREHNVRFVQNPIPTCKYFVASQCHPSVFDALEGYDVWIWHAKNNIGENVILDDYYIGNYYPIIGGSTVMLRAIWMMRLLGFKEMEIYGFDSCMRGDKHHIYEQKENDGSEVRLVVCADKEFYAAAWMLSQADDFMHFVKNMGKYFSLNIHGDGLISHIVKKGAEYYNTLE